VSGSLAAELLKLRKRWAIRILVVLFVLIVAGLQYLLPYAIYKNPPPNFGGDLPRGTTIADLIRTLETGNFQRVALQSMSGLGGAIAIILGVLVAGSEYSWGTIRTVMAQRPGRVAVVAGKLTALALLTLLFTVVLMGAAALCSVAVAATEHADFAWADVATIGKAVLAGWLILSMWALFGVALAVLFRQTALPIGIGLIYAIVLEGIIFALFGSNATLQNIEKAFPGANAGALVATFGSGVRGLRTQGIAGPSVDPTQAVFVLLGYAIVFAAIAVLAVRQRDQA
jgi:ABC-2 type transport system permease protein